MTPAGPAAPRPSRPRPESPTGTRSRRRERGELAQRLLPARLMLLALAGFLLFGYPFLAVFSRAERLAGIPVLYVYLFVAWAGFIAAIARLVDAGGRRR